MRDSYEVDETKYELKFKDENKMMILIKKEPAQGVLDSSIINFEEHLIESGYKCEMIKE